MAADTRPAAQGAQGARTARAVRDSWRSFTVLLVAQALIAVSDTVVLIALPSIGRDLHMDPVGATWVLNAYIVALGALLVVGGRVADVVGRRRLLAAGLVVFAASSGLAAVAPATAILIGARAAQGVAGALMTPAAMSLIADIFGAGRDRERALGWFAGIGGVAGSAGGLIGGMLAQVSWRAVFGALALLSAALLVATRRLPAGARPGQGLPDLPGALAGAAGISLLLFAGVRAGAGRTWTVTDTLALLLTGFALAYLRRRQSRARNPLLPAELVAHRAFPAAGLVMAGVGFLLFGGFYVITLYLQDTRGVGPFAASLWQLPASVAVIVGSRVAPRLVSRLGPSRTVIAGGLLQAVALAAAVTDLLPGPPANMALYLLPTTLWGVGLGISLVSGFISATAYAGAQQGAATGAATMFMQVGGAAGVAVLGLLAMEDSSSPAAVHVAMAVAALAGAVVAFGGWLLARGVTPASQNSCRAPRAAHPCQA